MAPPLSVRLNGTCTTRGMFMWVAKAIYYYSFRHNIISAIWNNIILNIVHIFSASLGSMNVLQLFQQQRLDRMWRCSSNASNSNKNHSSAEGVDYKYSSPSPYNRGIVNKRAMFIAICDAFHVSIYRKINFIITLEEGKASCK